MYDKVLEVRTSMSKLHTLYKQATSINTLREKFLTDPAAAIMEMDTISGIDTNINKFKKIFESSVNVPIAAGDALDIINSSLINTLKELSVAETAIKNSVDSMQEALSVIIKLIIGDTRIEIIVNGLNKANGSLPQAELFEKRLEAAMCVIMANAGIMSSGYIKWLYGISKELDEDNTIALINDISYKDLTDYLTDAEVLEVTGSYSPPDYDAPNVSDKKYSNLVNYLASPDSNISGLSIVTAIVKDIVETNKEMSAPISSITIEDTASVAEALVAKELEVPTANPLDSIRVFIKEYEIFLHKLGIGVNQIIISNIIANKELNKRLAIQSMLAEAIIKDK